MKDVIVYSGIEYKNDNSVGQDHLSETEALIHTLNVIDFNVALTQQNADNLESYDDIDWVILEPISI